MIEHENIIDSTKICGDMNYEPKSSLSFIQWNYLTDKMEVISEINFTNLYAENAGKLHTNWLINKIITGKVSASMNKRKYEQLKSFKVINRDLS